MWGFIKNIICSFRNDNAKYELIGGKKDKSTPLLQANKENNWQLNYSICGEGRDKCIFCSSVITFSGEARSFGEVANILKATFTMF